MTKRNPENERAKRGYFNYLRNAKGKDETSLEKRVKKYFHWSSAEWGMQKILILEHPEFWAQKFALNNKERKEIGLDPIKLEAIKKEKTGNGFHQGTS